MEKKHIAATVTTILCALLFIVIGSTFSAFIYKNEMIELENPKVYLAQGMQIFNSEGDKVIDELELSKMKLGLKPSTGEEDVLSGIPVTVTDKQGSEGQYVKFKLYAPEGAKVVVSNINIDSKQNEEDIKKERENIMVAVKEIDKSAKSLALDRVELGWVAANDERIEYTFYVWLSNKTSEKLEASKISFDVLFESVE